MSSLSQNDDIGRRAARVLLNKYFTTQPYPYTRHHIDSFDQFLSRDLIAILKSQNPLLILKDLIENTNSYTYKVEIFVGGKNGDAVQIGTPIVNLEAGEDVRLLFPNEARLRNLTYSSEVTADVLIRLTFTERRPDGQLESREREIEIPAIKLFRIPIMLHSRYCLLHDKPKEFLQQAGECPYDHGGYFIVDGAEKVLVTRQEQAFNTLYISNKDRDPKIRTYASLASLSPETRAVKRVAFAFMRNSETLLISLPFVRKPVNVFVLFRAMGIQSDEAIMDLIFPDRTSADYQFLADKLIPTITDAFPILNTFTAVQFIKTLTKGFSEVHVLDIIKNQLFIHVPDTAGARVNFLAECVRNILRVTYGFEKPTDRDDIRTQRCLTSGFLVQMLFSGVYAKWRKAVALSVDKEWEYNKRIYAGESFANIFSEGNRVRIFNEGYMTEGLMRGFKGKWGSGIGEEKTGVLQALSRLSYLDFMSHCRRVVLDFDTSMKLPGPRHLHTSQFGYFCTNETPSGASIGITKNLSILTSISTAVPSAGLVEWLRTRGGVATCASVTPEQKQVFVPVALNNGIIGYTATPLQLLKVLKAMKHTGWLPPTVGLGFSYIGRRLFIFTDEGRPLRPLVIIRNGQFPVQAIAQAKTWRDLLLGTHPRRQVPLDTSTFEDPLAEAAAPTFEDYMRDLTPHLSVLEYVDPYEHNETYIASFPEHIVKETTHVEVHPSTMMSLMTSLIPYANHNQSPRNQLSCSQSKQGLSIYATNWLNRFDNSAHILCYPEAPLVRTLYYDYAAEGRLGYGANCVLALAMYEGYNQEDGIVFNKDALARGLFRSIAYRSYEFYEEDDEKTGSKLRIGNPARIAGWTDIKPGMDYLKLDDRGIVRVGEYVDEDTIIVGGYYQVEKGKYKDASITPQVWTRGRVESVTVTVNNKGLRLVRIRVAQDRTPELGDKFCLTPEHEVLTEAGWKYIGQINEADKVCTLAEDGTTIQYTTPTGFYSFQCEDEYLYRVQSPQIDLVTTLNHKMYVKRPASAGYELVEAKDLINLNVTYLSHDGEIPVDKTNSSHDLVKYTGAVYCIEVPSHIFYVRRNGKAVWTGNSNRHGQKGTMGMMFPAVDMPRSANGMVPDMIVNPHSIPSRMTMAQLLEQLLGKTAAIHGAIGDATSFMNEGSPAEAIGQILEEQYGFERTGNEILYDGTTGVQIPTAIFVAPVYGMRLKHMVEDKWQARTTGRREQRTHQPTGGRGKEGGLRFGEQERDTMITHGTAGFLQESGMKRSDGTQFPICTGCGTIPIYNERLGISVCPLCQGPVKFAGNTADTLELIPPLTKPQAPVVQVEMPYVLKVLDQELATFMNSGLRFITSGGGTQHINVDVPEVQDAGITPAVILPERIIPETDMAEYEPAKPAEQEVSEPTSLTNLAAMAKSVGMVLVPAGAAMPLTPVIEENTAALAESTESEATENTIEPPPLPLQTLTVLGAPAPPPPTIIQAPTALPVMTQQAAVNATVGPTVIVDTSPRALANEGLIIEDVGANGINAAVPNTLRIRRNRPSVRFNEEANEESAAPPANKPVGPVTVVKLG